MKTKKCLENHHNPGMRKIIIKNMKARMELKMDIALNDMLKKFPGGENFYIANNGHIREKTSQQRAYQNRFSSSLKHPLPGLAVPQPRASSVPSFNHPQGVSLPPTLTVPPALPQQFSRPPPALATHPMPLPFSSGGQPSLLTSASSSIPYMFPGTQYQPVPPQPTVPFIFTGTSQHCSGQSVVAGQAHHQFVQNSQPSTHSNTGQVQTQPCHNTTHDLSLSPSLLAQSQPLIDLHGGHVHSEDNGDQRQVGNQTAEAVSQQ